MVKRGPPSAHAYLHAFLSNKQIIFSQKNEGGDPPFTPQIVIPGWTAGGVRALSINERPPRHSHIFTISHLYRRTHITNQSLHHLGFTGPAGSTLIQQDLVILVRKKCVRCTLCVQGRTQCPLNLALFFLLSSFFPCTYFSPRWGLPWKLKFGG